MKTKVLFLCVLFIVNNVIAQIKVYSIVKQHKIIHYKEKYLTFDKILRRHDYNQFGEIICSYDSLNIYPYEELIYDSLGRIIEVYSGYNIVKYYYESQTCSLIPNGKTVITDQYFDYKANKNFAVNSNNHFIHKYILDSSCTLYQSLESYSHFDTLKKIFDSTYYTNMYFHLPLNEQKACDTSGYNKKDTYSFDSKGFVIKYSPKPAVRHPVIEKSVFNYNKDGLLVIKVKTKERQEYDIWLKDSIVVTIAYNQYNDISQLKTHHYYVEEGSLIKEIIETNEYDYKYDMSRQKKQMLVYPKGIPIEYHDSDLQRLFWYKIPIPSGLLD